MKVLFDTDVLLDVLLDREPFSESSARLLSLAELSEIQGCVAATSVTTLFYLVRKSHGAVKTKRAVDDLLAMLEVASVNRVVIHQAVSSRMRDFEDAVVAYAAHESQADVIATRNVKDFKHAPVVAQAPSDILAALAAERSDD